MQYVIPVITAALTLVCIILLAVLAEKNRELGRRLDELNRKLGEEFERSRRETGESQARMREETVRAVDSAGKKLDEMRQDNSDRQARFEKAAGNAR